MEPMLDDWTGPHGGYPPFDKVTVAGMEPALMKGMDPERAEIKAIAGNQAEPTFVNTLAALEDAGRPFTRATRLFDIWTSTLNSPDMQEVEAKMSPCARHSATRSSKLKHSSSASRPFTIRAPGQVDSRSNNV